MKINERKGRKSETKIIMRSGRRPSHEGARLLVFAGAISPMVCPVDESTEGRHEKTRRKARKEKKRESKRTETRS